MVLIYYCNLGLKKHALSRRVYIRSRYNVKFEYRILIQFEKSELKKVWKFKFRYFEKNNTSKEGALHVSSWTRIQRTSHPRFYRFIEFVPKTLVETKPGWDDVYVFLEVFDPSGVKKAEFTSNVIKVLL